MTVLFVSVGDALQGTSFFSWEGAIARLVLRPGGHTVGPVERAGMPGSASSEQQASVIDLHQVDDGGGGVVHVYVLLCDQRRIFPVNLENSRAFVRGQGSLLKQTSVALTLYHQVPCDRGEVAVGVEVGPGLLLFLCPLALLESPYEAHDTSKAL